MNAEILEHTARISAAFLSHNPIPVSDVPSVISTVAGVLQGLGRPDPALEAVQPQQPAVPIRKSVGPDFIVCLEDGKKLKMLKRHLSSTYNMTPEEYRAKWGLPADYPMVAPRYAE